jgi:hypothetical protein
MMQKPTKAQWRRDREWHKRHIGTCSCGAWYAVGNRWEVEYDASEHDTAGGQRDDHVVQIVRKRFGGRP